MLITLKYEGGSTTARDQTVTVSVERTTGFRGFILTGGECHQTIERSDAVHVCLLGTTTDNAVLQTILDKQITQTHRV